MILYASIVRRTRSQFDRPTAAYVTVALVGILAISLFPLEFGTGPYCTVHGPLLQIGSQSEWRMIIALWLNAFLLLLLLHSDSHRYPSRDPQTLTYTLNC
jgi:hypothetical protein